MTRQRHPDDNSNDAEPAEGNEDDDEGDRFTDRALLMPSFIIYLHALSLPSYLTVRDNTFVSLSITKFLIQGPPKNAPCKL